MKRQVLREILNKVSYSLLLLISVKLVVFRNRRFLPVCADPLCLHHYNDDSNSVTSESNQADWFGSPFESAR